jgi:glutathione S-transferase
MATIQIYGVPSSPFTRATRLAAREKGVDYELVPTRPGETAPLNPLGKMPMMKHGDFTPYDRRRRRPISSWCRSFSIFPKLRS